jgi:hypothetical protein
MSGYGARHFGDVHNDALHRAGDELLIRRDVLLVRAGDVVRACVGVDMRLDDRRPSLSDVDSRVRIRLR